MAIHDAFTAAEDNYLKDNYPIKPWDDLLKDINEISPVVRTKQSIISRASSLGVRRSNSPFGLYTSEEDAMITSVYLASEKQCISKNLSQLISDKMPHRTLSSVLNRVNSLGLRTRENWSDEDDQFLIENYYTMTTAELAEKLGRTSEAVYNRIRKFGLRGAPMSMYTDTDKRYVAEHYLTMSDDEIGAVLHRRGQNIKEFRRKFGLYKPKPENVIYSFQQYIHRHNNEWKGLSAKKCDYKCVISGGVFHAIHHLYGRSLIVKEVLENHPEYKGVNINEVSDDEKQSILKLYMEVQSKYPLGVCLREDYHIQFHRMYGYGNNTPDQFYEYIKKVAPDRLEYIMNL